MFIIEIPVVEQETYNYYYLFPLVVWHNNKFDFILNYEQNNYMLLYHSVNNIQNEIVNLK